MIRKNPLLLLRFKEQQTLMPTLSGWYHTISSRHHFDGWSDLVTLLVNCCFQFGVLDQAYHITSSLLHEMLNPVNMSLFRPLAFFHNLSIRNLRPLATILH